MTARLLINTDGNIRAYTSESDRTTVLAVGGGVIHFEGLLSDRQRVVEHLAEAVGLQIVSPAE